MYEIGWMNPIRPLTTLLYLSYIPLLILLFSTIGISLEKISSLPYLRALSSSSEVVLIDVVVVLLDSAKRYLPNFKKNVKILHTWHLI